MPLIAKLSERLKRHPKRVVFPEGADPRILQAARKFATRGLGIPILVGDRALIKENAERLDISLEHIRLADPRRSDEFDLMVRQLRALPRFSELDADATRRLAEDANYHATLMLAAGQADAIVAGATVTASSALRPLLQIIPRQGEVKTVSSLNIFDLEDPDTGSDRELFLADCAVIPNPEPEQLCDIALTTAALGYHLSNREPRVAFLSYTSKSESSSDPVVAKMRAATELARRKAPGLGIPVEIDGEMQVDAALEATTARTKGLEGSVAGQANVLVFPDLHAANIASKLVAVLTRARNYGPILTGLAKPAAEISRGATAGDIFGTAVMVAAQAVDHQFLYPRELGELRADPTRLD